MRTPLQGLIWRRTARGLAGLDVAVASSASRRMLEDTNSAKGTMFPRELAASSVAMYSFRRASSMTVHGHPPEAIIAFIKNRPIRPFPSG